MSEFKVGDKVVDRYFPTLTGTVIEIIPANPEIEEHEIAVVKIWIPENEPGFMFTGVYEEMWYAPAELRHSAPDK